MAKKFVQSGQPPEPVVVELQSDEQRRANRERIAKSNVRKSAKSKKKMVSRDPRIADTKRDRWRSRSVARDERGQAVRQQKLEEKAAGIETHEWPKQGKTLAQHEAQLVRKEQKRRAKEIAAAAHERRQREQRESW